MVRVVGQEPEQPPDIGRQSVQTAEEDGRGEVDRHVFVDDLTIDVPVGNAAEHVLAGGSTSLIELVPNDLADRGPSGVAKIGVVQKRLSESAKLLAASLGQAEEVAEDGDGVPASKILDQFHKSRGP